MPRQFEGTTVVGGHAQGDALVSRDRISVNLGIDERTGIVVERGHDLEGQSVAGKVLIFPGEKGSGGSSFSLYQLVSRGIGPVALVNLNAGPIIAAGAALSKVPLVHAVDAELFSYDWTGRQVLVEATSSGARLTFSEA